MESMKRNMYSIVFRIDAQKKKEKKKSKHLKRLEKIDI